jgi:hypothetical protein
VGATVTAASKASPAAHPPRDASTTAKSLKASSARSRARTVATSRRSTPQSASTEIREPSRSVPSSVATLIPSKMSPRSRGTQVQLARARNEHREDSGHEPLRRRGVHQISVGVNRDIAATALPTNNDKFRNVQRPSPGGEERMRREHIRDEAGWAEELRVAFATRRWRAPPEDAWLRLRSRRLLLARLLLPTSSITR